MALEDWSLILAARDDDIEPPGWRAAVRGVVRLGEVILLQKTLEP